MGTILDALAAHRVRGALRTLLSSHQTNRVEYEGPDSQYVCARKSYTSGRKGRISVYRVRDEYANEHGQMVKLYANVQGADLDEDERGSFAGVERISSHGRGRRVKQKTVQPAGRLKKSKREAQTLAIKPGKRREAGPIRSAKRGGSAQSEAFVQGKHPRAGPSEGCATRQEAQS